MQVKIDTSERFHAITIQEPVLSAIMTEEFTNKLSTLLNEDIKSVVLNLRNVVTIDLAILQAIDKLQQSFHQHNASFVTCCLTAAAKEPHLSTSALDSINLAPTESEASDIVFMEEIERELEED